MSDSKETLLGEIAAFVEANPYMAYGDYRDELSDEHGTRPEVEEEEA